MEWKLMSSHTQALVLVQVLVFDPLIEEEEEEEQDIICHSKKKRRYKNKFKLCVNVIPVTQ